MITINISEDQRERARSYYGFDALNGSLTKGKSNIYGALGEIIFIDFCREKGHVVKIESSYDYDLIVNDFKVDVKTKKTTVTPKPEYNCSIPAFNTKQKCDYYVFIRVMMDQSKAFILGAIDKSSFYSQANYKKKSSRSKKNGLAIQGRLLQSNH